MVYIEAILSLCNKHHSFRIDADDMKELMDKTMKVVKNTIQKCGAFEIILFNSNTMNSSHFISLMENSLK